MELIVKKCPTCTAQVSFEDGQEHTVCRFCDATIYKMQTEAVTPPPPVQISPPRLTAYDQAEMIRVNKARAKNSLVKIFITIIVIYFLGMIIFAIATILNEEEVNQHTRTEIVDAADENFHGSRNNPIQKGETGLFDGEGTISAEHVLEMTVADVVRGEEALQLVMDSNPFNTTPPEGMEYILVYFSFKALSSLNNEIVSINNSHFTFVSKDGIPYTDFVSIAGLEQPLINVYAGAEYIGIAYEIIDVEDIPMIDYLGWTGAGIWFNTVAEKRTE
jgi:hypothetical protein